MSDTTLNTELAKLNREYLSVKNDPVKMMEFEKKINGYKKLISIKVNEFKQLDDALRTFSKTDHAQQSPATHKNQQCARNNGNANVKMIERKVINNISNYSARTVHFTQNTQTNPMINADNKTSPKCGLMTIDHDVTQNVTFNYNFPVKWMCSYDISRVTRPTNVTEIDKRSDVENNITYSLNLKNFPIDHVVAVNGNSRQIRLHTSCYGKRILILLYENGSAATIGHIICSKSQ